MKTHLSKDDFIELVREKVRKINDCTDNNEKKRISYVSGGFVIFEEIGKQFFDLKLIFNCDVYGRYWECNFKDLK